MQTRDNPSAALRSSPLPTDPLAGRIRLARAALAWERLWLALWPAVAVLGAFPVLALFDILPALPAWLHALGLAPPGGPIGGSVWGAPPLFPPPPARTRPRRAGNARGPIPPPPVPPR